MNKFSENTVPILTGRGLSETRERIERAFAAIRDGDSSRKEVLRMVEQSNICITEVYSPTEFDRRAARLTTLAAASPHVMPEAPRDGVWRISLSGQSAEELIKEALGGGNK